MSGQKGQPRIGDTVRGLKLQIRGLEEDLENLLMKNNVLLKMNSQSRAEKLQGDGESEKVAQKMEELRLENLELRRDLSDLNQRHRSVQEEVQGVQETEKYKVMCQELNKQLQIMNDEKRRLSHTLEGKDREVQDMKEEIKEAAQREVEYEDLITQLQRKSDRLDGLDRILQNFLQFEGSNSKIIEFEELRDRLQDLQDMEDEMEDLKVENAGLKQEESQKMKEEDFKKLRIFEERENSIYQREIQVVDLERTLKDKEMELQERERKLQLLENDKNYEKSVEKNLPLETSNMSFGGDSQDNITFDDEEKHIDNSLRFQNSLNHSPHPLNNDTKYSTSYITKNSSLVLQRETKKQIENNSNWQDKDAIVIQDGNRESQYNLRSKKSSIIENNRQEEESQLEDLADLSYSQMSNFQNGQSELFKSNLQKKGSWSPSRLQQSSIISNNEVLNQNSKPISSLQNSKINQNSQKSRSPTQTLQSSLRTSKNAFDLEESDYDGTYGDNDEFEEIPEEINSSTFSLKSSKNLLKSPLKDPQQPQQPIQEQYQDQQNFEDSSSPIKNSTKSIRQSRVPHNTSKKQSSSPKSNQGDQEFNTVHTNDEISEENDISDQKKALKIDIYDEGFDTLKRDNFIKRMQMKSKERKSSIKRDSSSINRKSPHRRKKSPKRVQEFTTNLESDRRSDYFSAKNSIRSKPIQNHNQSSLRKQGTPKRSQKIIPFNRTSVVSNDRKSLGSSTQSIRYSNKRSVKKKISYGSVSNKQNIINAITRVLMAGVTNIALREKLVSQIKHSIFKNFVILFKNLGRHDLKAIYAFSNTGEIIKIQGNSKTPEILEDFMVAKYFKYQSSSRLFKPIEGNKGLSIAVDAVVLKANYHSIQRQEVQWVNYASFIRQGKEQRKN